MYHIIVSNYLLIVIKCCGELIILYLCDNKTKARNDDSFFMVVA